MVSIIIPTYNYARYLAETLQSVADQSYSDWECIVIDDGSADNTKEVFDVFVKNDNRFKFISQSNKGVSAARNAGIKAAKGDFIQFLDGDDLLQEDKIKVQIDVFKSVPEIDIAYSNVGFFDDGNNKQLRSSLNGNKPKNWLPKIRAKGKEVVGHFGKINFLVMNSPLIRKSVLDRVGEFDERMQALEDWDFWMRCALANCCFYFVDEQSNSFALVRVHQGSLSTQKKLMNNGHFMFIEHILTHKNSSAKSSLIFLIKYIELFWDSLLLKSYFGSNSIALTISSVLLLPVYGLTKLARVVK